MVLIVYLISGPVISLRHSFDLSPCTIAFNIDLILSHFNSEETLFAPEVAPTVPHNPVRNILFQVESPTSN